MPKPALNKFDYLSLRDLLDARDQYHIHLMQHPNVVATAVGRYLIRKKDSWPNASKKVHGTYARTLANSEVREYSWPAILVFVEEWQSATELSKKPGSLVPSTLYLADGRSVPVCVVEAPKEAKTTVKPLPRIEPLNNIGGGSELIAQSQGREYVATVGCLVGDGHTVYALTNRHVTGDPGTPVYARLNGNAERIGESSPKQLTKMTFEKLYPGLAGRNTYVNLDIGLIEIDDLDNWTAGIREIGQMGKMVDISASNISLSLVGQSVCGFGAVTGKMEGEISALFYRYKANGGFEYVADLFIGPRSTEPTRKKQSANAAFETNPGDSGTLWLLEQATGTKKSKKTEYLPLALQWGRNMLYSSENDHPQAFALATFLSRVCAELDVDPIRNWNLDQLDTWGGIGHFSVAARAVNALSSNFPKLTKLMKNNANIISHDDETILAGDFKGMGEADFVALADVPDFYWKLRIAKQGFARPMEGPNHFADMDQPNDHDQTLLALCKNDDYINPAKWNEFYESILDLKTGEKIELRHRGLLPFRVWQIFDGMVASVKKGDMPRFVCAAGVLTHYIGDACQPLHISYLHDGDPEQLVDYEITKGKNAGKVEQRAFGSGIHSAYEEKMISLFRQEVLDGLSQTPKAKKSELVSSGFEAAKRTIEMMRDTFKAIPPAKLVDAFGSSDAKPKEKSELLWKKFGKKTIEVMQGGSHLLAVLWESAWDVGNGNSTISATRALTENEAMKICQDKNFLPSVSIKDIGKHLN